MYHLYIVGLFLISHSFITHFFLVLGYKDEEMIFSETQILVGQKETENLLTPIGSMHKVCENPEEEAEEGICVGQAKLSKTLNFTLNCLDITLVISKARDCDRATL